MLVPTLFVVPSPLWSHGPRPDPTITKPRHKNTARNRGLLPHNAPTRPLCTRPGLSGYIYTIPLPSLHSGTHHDTHLVQRERLKGITTPHTSDASRVNRKAPGHKIRLVALTRPVSLLFFVWFFAFCRSHLSDQIYNTQPIAAPTPLPVSHFQLAAAALQRSMYRSTRENIYTTTTQNHSHSAARRHTPALAAGADITC
jgi:hypothetical protein